jgi:uncharacterized protein (DUF1501 family)
MNRREFLRRSTSLPVASRLGAAGFSAAGLSGLLSLPGVAAANDYRALVCIHLNGGNDGNNTLIPRDGAYSDYQKGRAELALPKDSLANLNGSSIGHTFGLHPALSPLATLYNQSRLAWVANVGPLVAPATARQVKDRSALVPPFLLSHSDQQAIQQGWLGDLDASGWAGRAMERLPKSLQNPLNAVTGDNNKTLVLGQTSRVSYLSPGGSRHWGDADLAQPQTYWAQSISRMAQWQFSNSYEAEYAKSLGASIDESKVITQAFLNSKTPTGEFPSEHLGNSLRSLASILPVFKSMGYRRQVFLIGWGGFDTHSDQRGSGPRTQDAQLDTLAKAVSAFDQSNMASGLGLDVTTFILSDFNRTLQPASGAGSDHAWGNHYFVMGGSVMGGQVLGQFPSLVLGGVDDFDLEAEGRFVPSTSSEQLGASLMRWMGLPADALLSVFPNLANFQQKSIPLMAG